MSRVLLLGYDPETVDFSDPALPPGMTVEKINAGIAVAIIAVVQGLGTQLNNTFSAVSSALK